MTEENKTEEVDYKAMATDLESKLAEAQQSIDNMASHQEKLLGETKAAKEAKKVADEEKTDRAKANGEFEELLKTAEARNNELLSQIKDNNAKQVNQNINDLAQKMTNELKAVPESAEALRRLVLGDIKDKVDENGVMSETIYNSIMKDLNNNEAYSPLLIGNQSNGGGAAGAKSGALSSNTIKQADWDKYSASKKTSVAKDLSSKGLSLSQVLEQ